MANVDVKCNQNGGDTAKVWKSRKPKWSGKAQAWFSQCLINDRPFCYQISTILLFVLNLMAIKHLIFI